jgi:hypothetical protein
VNHLLFFSKEAVGLVDAPTSLGGDWEPTLGAGPDGATFYFPLPELEVGHEIALAAIIIYFGDLHALGHIFDLPDYDINVIQHGHLLQQL